MNNLTCDICNELCSVSELKLHQKMHIHKDGFKCVICHAIVTTKYCLRRHVNLHFRRRSYKCQCGKIFYDCSNLTQHEKVCTLFRKTCKKCGKSFSRVDSLKRHLEEVHNRLNKPSDQKQQTGGSRGINTDIITTIPKDAVCNESSKTCKRCGKSFSRVSHLKRHLEVVHNKLNKPSDQKQQTCGSRGIHTDIKTTIPKDAVWNESGYPKLCRTCNHCGRTFSNNGNLNRHLKLHSRVVNLKLNKPSDQKQQTGESRGINTDIITTIPKDAVCIESSKICKKCGKSFGSFSNLKRHLEEVHKLNKPSVCRICHHCGRTFSNNGHLYQHLKVHSRLVNLKLNKPSNQNQQTGESIGINTDVITTIPKDAVCNESGYPKLCRTCHHCGRTFSNNGNLNRHLKLHLRVVNLKLNKPSDQKQQTGGSIGINTDIITTIPKDAVCNESSKICKKCGKSFGSFNNLKRHLEEVHKLNKPSVCRICHHCGRTFSNNGHLYSHLRVHSRLVNLKLNKPSDQNQQTGESIGINTDVITTIPKDAVCNENSICKKCGKGFSSVSILQRHLYFHHKLNIPSNQKQETDGSIGINTDIITTIPKDAVCNENKTCKECGKSLSSINNLKRHLEEVHIKKNTYRCSHCAYTCHNYCSFKRHLKIHSPTRKNVGNRNAVITKVCCICGKRFASIRICKRHMLIHLDLRLYKCLKCGLGYNDRSTLIRHKCRSRIPTLDHKPSTSNPSTSEPSTPERSTPEPSTPKPSTSTPGTSDPSTSEPSTFQDKQSSYVFTLLECEGNEKACLKSENINSDLSVIVENNNEENITECNEITQALQTGNVTDDCARVMEPCKIEEMTT